MPAKASAALEKQPPKRLTDALLLQGAELTLSDELFQAGAGFHCRQLTGQEVPPCQGLRCTCHEGSRVADFVSERGKRIINQRRPGMASCSEAGLSRDLDLTRCKVLGLGQPVCILALP